MALPAQFPTLSQASLNDLGRCGLAYHFNCIGGTDGEAATHAIGARLLTAASTGEVTQAMRCLADGVDINFTDSSNGETALHRAAQRKHLTLLELLLAAGADPNCRDRRNRSPLFFAASAGDLPSVRKLLAYDALLFPDQDASPHRQQQAGPTATSACSVPTAPCAGAASTGDDDDALLALRTSCPLAAAAAAAHWPVVAALLGALPPHYQRLRSALRSLRFLVWALASHKAFPREVIHRLPRRLPRCVVDAVRPAHLASTPLVLATGNDQQQLMQWLLQQGADPELGAPLLLCAGRFCRGSRTCCVNTLLRLGARPHVAWADNPSDSPLQLAARGDCFTHVHCLVAYGADVSGEAARVREALYTPAPWEAHLDVLMRQYGDLLSAPGADLLCPCGQQHAQWPGLWPLEGDEPAEEQQEQDGAGRCLLVEAAAEDADKAVGMQAAVAGAGGNSCHNLTPSDDAWYRHHRAQMEQLQDGAELAECRKAVDELWQYGCSAVVSELGGAPAAPHSLMPQRVLAALQDVAGGWLVAAARCRHQRLLRMDLYDKAAAAGRILMERKRLAALAALGSRPGVAAPAGPCGGQGSSSSSSGVYAGLATARLECASPALHAQLQRQRDAAACGALVEGRGAEGGCGGWQGLVTELRMEILALAGLAPPEVQPRAVSVPVREPCSCPGCKS